MHWSLFGVKVVPVRFKLCRRTCHIGLLQPPMHRKVPVREVQNIESGKEELVHTCRSLCPSSSQWHRKLQLTRSWDRHMRSERNGVRIRSGSDSGNRRRGHWDWLASICRLGEHEGQLYARSMYSCAISKLPHNSLSRMRSDGGWAKW